MLQRFPAPPVPGIPPPAMYKLDPGIGVPTAPTGAAQPLPTPPFDFHPVSVLLLIYSHCYKVLAC